MPTLLARRIANLKIQLTSDSEAWPGVLDSERDRWILINEKEEPLKETLPSAPGSGPKGRWSMEMACKRLEKDLQAARTPRARR